jgi:carboxyl-terminal processing protease
MVSPYFNRSPIISVIKFTLQSAFIFSIASTSVWSSALDQLEQTELPTNVEKQSKTTKLINYLIDKSHYRKITLNDEFSARVLDTYIESLDPSRSFFLSQDIEKFNELRYELDDYIKQGNLELPYSIFKIYRSRVNQRIEFALERLKQPFDFTIDETFILDREDTNWANSEQQINDYWRKRIKNDILNLKLAAKDQDEIQETLLRRYTHIARRTRQFKSEDVFQSFINAYVTTIEPHTSYYSPRGAENFKIHMRLSLEGIGAVLQTENEHTLVRRIIEGGPADFSGALNADDRIIGVGQENEEIVDVIGWRLDDVVELIRGPKESIVNLEILPAENGLDGESETITIVRDKIKLEEQAASKRVLEIGSGENQSTVGVIDLPSFYSDFDGRNINDPDYRSTTKDVRKLVEEMKLTGIDGLVIDLRGNGGGALTEAISLTGLFIKKGPVVQVQHSNGRTQVDRDPDPEIIYDGPMSVLVDRYSASASEIFAGAIQDYNRGLIIGESTFGKGTVQNLVSLNRFVNSDEDLGQLKVTIAQFFRINGDSTQHRGVVPDISWHINEPDEDSGESSFENAIPWRHIDEVAFTPFEPELDESVLDKTREIHLKRIENNAEFEYAFEANKINKTNRERTSITLSEKARTDDRKTRDAIRLALENSRRESLGKATYSSVEILEKEVEKEAKQRENEGNENSQADAFLVESAHILVDFIHLTSKSNFDEQSTTLVDSDSANSEALLSN